MTGLTVPNPPVTFTFEVRAVNAAGGGTAIQVTVTPIVGVAVAVPLTATRGAGLQASEYIGVPGSVTFAAGETSKGFTVTARQDTDDEPNETLTLEVGTLPAGYVVGANVELVLTVVDDDHPFVAASFGAAAASALEGGSVEVTVTLTAEPEHEVVLPIVATRGANHAADEYSGVPASVTFAADETQAGFTVTFVDDAAVEGNETLTLVFGTRPERVTPGSSTRLVLTVTDDDGPRVEVPLEAAGLPDRRVPGGVR